jgi:hypothetical protein
MPGVFPATKAEKTSIHRFLCAIRRFSARSETKSKYSFDIHAEEARRLVMYKSLLSTIAALFVSFAMVDTARARNAQPAEPKTAATVIAADQGWDKAEESGDTTYIDALLLPEYRSISSDGSTHDKAAILASARKNVASPEREAAATKWKAAHPSLTSVQITGDLAILTFTLDKPVAQKPVMSCDVFVYRDGRWHALYSQHTSAGS